MLKMLLLKIILEMYHGSSLSKFICFLVFKKIYMFPGLKKKLYVSLSIASNSPKKKIKSSAYNRWRVRVAVEATYLPSPVAAVEF